MTVEIKPDMKALPIDEEERAKRKEAIDFARGSVRLEGIILPHELETLNQRYIDGEISDAEHTRLGLELIDALDKA